MAMGRGDVGAETSGSSPRGRSFTITGQPFASSRKRFVLSQRGRYAAHVVADYREVYAKGGTDRKSCNTVVGRRYGLPTGAYRYTQALCRTEVEYGLYWRHLLHG
ncbi:hypothetical protein K0M31_014767 [Melipona bicolor]|uniref:Uncharacterized protein n=1 Tax=Melipona bicolor TaxID=60889 RepID=A0AA40KG10_9HYME|nr:hypothetical protein K0M31_014767 [Melipona bicolor]